LGITKTLILEQFIQEYSTDRPNYEIFRLKLAELLTALIEDAGIDIVSIESRTKTIQSFKEKIQRPEKNYSNPLDQITDLCGIRIITYYTEDIYKIADIIESEFAIDEDNSVDKTKITSPDKFGYLSLHYVLKLNKKRNYLIEWKNFKNLKAEIQIRSILQHSWAAIDHKLRYKIKKEIPSSLQRKIFRLSALLELADEEFLSIKKQTEELSTEIELSIAKGNLDIEFNSISLKSYLHDNNLTDDIKQKALKLGFTSDTEDINDPETQEYFLMRLIATLDNSRLNSIRELDNFLNTIFPYIEGKLKLVKDAFDEISDENIYANKSDLVLMLLVLSEETKIDITDPKLRNLIQWQPLLDCFDFILKN